MIRHTWQWTFVALVVAALACGRGTVVTGTPSPVATSQATTGAAPTPAATIPADFRETYDWLAQTLAEAQAQCPEASASAAPVFGAELIVANGNRGEGLLQPSTPAGVRLYLDRLQELGVQGVTVEIKFPLLQPDFPRSDEYLQFYKDVAREVKGRGMTLLIESGPPFPDAQYSSVPFDPASYSAESYLQARQTHNVRIVRELQPDYFSLVDEPDTEQLLMGLKFTVNDYVGYINATLEAIGETDTQVGAGAGTWDDPAYIEHFLSDTGVDFINLHVYPLASANTNYLERLQAWAQLARERGRAVTVGEAWLYKTLPGELGQIHYANVFARDAYRFWQPLDAQFMKTLACLAREQHIAYLAFFWSGYFFDYLDYEQTPADLSPVERQAQLNEAQLRRILAGEFSPTGEAYRDLIRQMTQP